MRFILYIKGKTRCDRVRNDDLRKGMLREKVV